MKRSLKQLQEDAQAQQEDDLLRAQIEREELAEAAEARKNSRENAFSDKWRGYLEKWEEHGLRIASNQELRLPRAAVPGPLSPVPDPFHVAIPLIIYCIQL